MRCRLKSELICPRCKLLSSNYKYPFNYAIHFCFADAFEDCCLGWKEVGEGIGHKSVVINVHVPMVKGEHVMLCLLYCLIRCIGDLARVQLKVEIF